MDPVLALMTVANPIIKKVPSKLVLVKGIICKKMRRLVQVVMIILSLVVKAELLFQVSRIKELLRLLQVQGLMIQ
jgi:hypothetical protein